MTDPQPIQSRDLVHLITCLALMRNLRDPILNIIATYLATVAERDVKPIEDVMFGEQERVLAPALQDLAESIMPTIYASSTDQEADAEIIGRFFEHLATIAGVLPKHS